MTVAIPMLARRLAAILPAMTLTAALETTRIPRDAGLTGGRTAVVTTRPFRVPHHAISNVGLIGGGQVPMPGEVSLAHHGILLLDEFLKCTRHVLKVLRQPFQDRLLQKPSRAHPRRRGAGGASCAGQDRDGLAPKPVISRTDVLGQGVPGATFLLTSRPSVPTLPPNGHALALHPTCTWCLRA